MCNALDLSTGKSDGQDGQPQSKPPQSVLSKQRERQATRSLVCSIIKGGIHPGGKMVNVAGIVNTMCKDQQRAIGHDLLGEWQVFRLLESGLGVRRIKEPHWGRNVPADDRVISTPNCQEL